MADFLAPAAQAGIGAAEGAITTGSPSGALFGALNALSGIGSSGGGPKQISSDMNDRSPINIAPVGVNLGAIIQPFDQGGVSNGGSGLEMLSRYLAGGDTSRVNTPLTTPVSMSNSWVWVAVAGAGVVAIYFFMKGR
jgi:hypothetical protein